MNLILGCHSLNVLIKCLKWREMQNCPSYCQVSHILLLIFFSPLTAIYCIENLLGSGQRRLKNIRKKKEEELTPDEKKFLAYCDYVSVKRSKYFEEKKKREAEEAAKSGENKDTEEKDAEVKMDVETSQTN